MFKKYLERAKIKGRFGVHSLRHTFGSHLYAKTKNLRLVQECLGHPNVQTTFRYTHLDQSEVKKAVNRLYQED